MTVRIEVRPYPIRIDGVFVEPLMLERVSRILGRSKTSLAKSDRAQFWRDFTELCNLAELICLEENLLVLHVQSHDDYFGSQISPVAIRELQPLHDVIAPVAPFTIDDLQKRRVFERWMSLGHLQKRLQAASSALSGRTREWLTVKQMLAGCLAEELIEAPYFPSSDNAADYLEAGPFWHDTSLYSVILDAYTVLREGEKSRRELRNLIGNIREPVIPPVTTLILSKINSPAEFLDELLQLREKFRPLRSRTTELKNLAGSDVPMGEWLNDYQSLTNEISQLAKGYGDVHSRIEVSKIDPREYFTLAAKLDESVLFSFDIKKLVGLGLDRIVQLIKRRRIQPLPSLRNRLARVGKMSPLIEKVFGVSVGDADLNILMELSRPFDELLKNRNPDIQSVRSPSSSQPRFRSGIESLPYIEKFNFEQTLREFGLLMKAGITPDYSAEERLIDVGFMYLDFKQPKIAKRYFQEALDLNSGSAGALHGLGMVSREEGNLHEAFTQLKMAHDIDPTTHALLIDLGVVASESGDDALALAYWEKAVTAKEDRPWASFNIGSLHARKGNYTAARTAFKTALKSYPEFHGALFSLGCLEEEHGDLKQAIDIYRRTIHMMPTRPRYWGRLGFALFANGDFLESAQALRRFIELDKDSKATLPFLGAALYLGKQYEQAVSVFAEVIAGGTTAEIHQHYGLALYAVGRLNEAIEQYEESYRVDPSNPNPLNTIAKIYLEAGRNGEAQDVLARLLDVDPRNGEALFLLGKSVFNEGDLPQALGYFRRAVKNGFAEQDEFFGLAVRLDGLRDFENAASLYRLELEVSDQNAESLANLASDLFELGNYNEAFGYAQKSCELKGDDPINLLALANAYILLERREEAKDPLLRILQLSKTSDPSTTVQAKRLLEWLSRPESNERLR